MFGQYVKPQPIVKKYKLYFIGMNKLTRKIDILNPTFTHDDNSKNKIISYLNKVLHSFSPINENNIKKFTYFFLFVEKSLNVSNHDELIKYLKSPTDKIVYMVNYFSVHQQIFVKIYSNMTEEIYNQFIDPSHFDNDNYHMTDTTQIPNKIDDFINILL